MTWQIDLIKRYPLLFRSETPSEACGYPSVGDGWQMIVEKAAARIDAAIRKLADGESALLVRQIKEKLGGLRIYVDWTSLPPDIAAEVRDAIDLAEARAASTCEACGAPGRLYDCDGWYLTRCDRHAEGEPVPSKYGDSDLHLESILVGGQMRVIRCRRYCKQKDAFVDAPLPPGERWAKEDRGAVPKDHDAA